MHAKVRGWVRKTQTQSRWVERGSVCEMETLWKMEFFTKGWASSLDKEDDLQSSLSLCRRRKQEQTAAEWLYEEDGFLGGKQVMTVDTGGKFGENLRWREEGCWSEASHASVIKGKTKKIHPRSAGVCLFWWLGVFFSLEWKYSKYFDLLVLVMLLFPPLQYCQI